MTAMCGCSSAEAACASFREAAPHLIVMDDVVGEDLQGDVPVQPRIGGPIHHAHAATADLFQNAVVA